MADFEIIRKRLEKKILASGHTFREVSLKIGRKDSYIQQYVKYGFPKRLNEVDRKKICQLLGMEEQELVDEELLESGIKQSELAEEITPQNTTLPTDFSTIDMYSPLPETELKQCLVGRMALKVKSFPDWCGSSPHNLKIIRLTTDCMEPTFPNGTLIVYNTDVREYLGDGIYLVQCNGCMQTKRVQKISQTVYLLKSDNRNYEDIPCPENELVIFGRALSCISSHLI